MIDKFESLQWHDAELLSIIINRRNPGNKDEIVCEIRWPSNELSELVFYECYAFEANMNFGILATESVLQANLIYDSAALNEIKSKWTKIGVDIDKLVCFEIQTNSTNSNLCIYALGFRICRISE